MSYDPGAQWSTNLKEGGYVHHCHSERDLHRIMRLGSAWRRIFRYTRLRPPASAFEVGCGGGDKLAALALNGFSVAGIDVSSDVLNRARAYFAEIEAVRKSALDATLIEGDIFSFAGSGTFDLVYHFGVVEHYLDDERRRSFWARSVSLASPNGWIVSVVPCGSHLMRRRMREQELLGYQNRLAEIDYSTASHAAEFQAVGLQNTRVLPHNYFFFLSGHPNVWVRRLLFPLMFGLGNALLPWLPLPVTVKERFAHTLIAIGQVPATPQCQ